MKRLGFSLLLIILIISQSVATPIYTITDLGTLPATTPQSIPADINNTGKVVGTSKFGSGYDHAFLWETGVMTDLGTFFYRHSIANSINNSGWVVGWADTLDEERCPFLYDGNVITYPLGGIRGNALCINDAGQVVGQLNWAAAEGVKHAFLWDDAGGVQDLGTLGGLESYAYHINNSEQVVGWSEIAGGVKHAFLWDDAGGMQDLGTLGGLESLALGNNDAGQVVGWSEIAGGVEHAFLWDDAGGMQALGFDVRSQAKDINISGQVVGTYWSGEANAFLWENGVRTNLNSLLPNDSDWFLYSANAINDAGQIVGEGRIHDQLHAYLLTPSDAPPPEPPPDPIPEPTTIVLMGFGLLGLLGVVIRQRRKEK